MSESGLWRYLRSHVNGVDWVRVENPVHPGTPDVNYAIDYFDQPTREGWAELKWIPKFPRKPTKPVFGEKKGLNTNQVRWIARRTKYGGRVWIVAGVGRKIFFLNGHSYAPSFNTMTRSDFDAIHPMWILERNGDVAFQTKVIRLLSLPGHRRLGVSIAQPGSLVRSVFSQRVPCDDRTREVSGRGPPRRGRRLGPAVSQAGSETPQKPSRKRRPDSALK